VKSTTGQIKFDVDSANQAEMTLNGTGLGVGITPAANLHVNGNAIVSGQLFVGGSNGSSNLNVNGTIGFGFQTVTSSTTLSGNSIVLADTSSGNLVLSLPEASLMDGRKYEIKKTSVLNSLSIRDGGLIDDYSDVSLSVNNMGSLSLISNSGNWSILSLSGNGTLISTDNLFGWWKLDEISGNVVVDSSSAGYQGAATGFASDNIGVNGKINQSIDFDGTNDYVNMGDVNDVGANEDFSLAFWFKTNDDATGQSWPGFVSKEDGSGPRSGYLVILNSSSLNKLTLETWSAGSQDSVTSINTVNDDIWHHAVAVRDCSAGEIRLYIDGVLNGTDSTISTGTLSSATDFVIGARLSISANRTVKSLIDDVRFYNRFLYPSEIQALYDQRQ
jgi:hypothetical protein